MYDYIFLAFILSAYLLLTNSANLKSRSYRNINAPKRTWDEAIALATGFAGQMTLEEKCNMTSSVVGACAGFVTPVPRLNFTGLCFQDSPSGVGDHVQFSTAFTAGIQIAATWDRDLFYKRAAAIGQEFKGKGIHFALGPMMNIDRNARICVTLSVPVSATDVLPIGIESMTYCQLAKPPSDTLPTMRLFAN